MTLTEEEQEKVMERAAQIVADRIWDRIQDSVDEVTLLTPARAAGQMDLSTSQLNRVLGEYVDFGPQTGRVSLAQLRKLVAARTVKKGGGKRRRTVPLDLQPCRDA